MGSEYRLILLDEFSWDYASTNKHKVVDNIIECFPDIEVESTQQYMLVFDIGRNDPEKVVEVLKNTLSIPFDNAYYMKDNIPELIKLDVGD